MSSSFTKITTISKFKTLLRTAQVVDGYKQLPNLDVSGLRIRDLLNDSVNFSHSKFSDTRFEYSELAKCNFEGVTFTRVEMMFTGLDYSNFTDATFNDSSINNYSKLNYCNFTNAKFINSMLDRNWFTSSNFTNAVFENSNLSSTSFDMSNLLNAKITDCDLFATKFTRVNNLNPANFVRPIHLEESMMSEEMKDEIKKNKRIGEKYLTQWMSTDVNDVTSDGTPTTVFAPPNLLNRIPPDVSRHITGYLGGNRKRKGRNKSRRRKNKSRRNKSRRNKSRRNKSRRR